MVIYWSYKGGFRPAILPILTKRQLRHASAGKPRTVAPACNASLFILHSIANERFHAPDQCKPRSAQEESSEFLQSYKRATATPKKVAIITSNMKNKPENQITDRST
jgi:hypothetical protein